MNTVIYVTIKQLDEKIQSILGESGLLEDAPLPIFDWAEADDGTWTLELQCGWPLSPALRAWVDRMAASQGLRHDEVEAQVDVLSGDHIPDDAYWTDTQADVDARKPDVWTPAEPGTDLGVWYRSSRDVANKDGWENIRVRGAWFGEGFESVKANSWEPGVLTFRGREYPVPGHSDHGHIVGLTEEQQRRINFIRGTFRALAEHTDGCYGGQADGIGIVLDEALRS